MTDQLDPIEIDAKLNALLAQREQAMNQIVNMAAMIAKLQAKVKELEPKDEEKKDV